MRKKQYYVKFACEICYLVTIIFIYFPLFQVQGRAGSYCRRAEEDVPDPATHGPRRAHPLPLQRTRRAASHCQRRDLGVQQDLHSSRNFFSLAPSMPFCPLPALSNVSACPALPRASFPPFFCFVFTPLSVCGLVLQASRVPSRSCPGWRI